MSVRCVEHARRCHDQLLGGGGRIGVGPVQIRMLERALVPGTLSGIVVFCRGIGCTNELAAFVVIPMTKDILVALQMDPFHPVRDVFGRAVNEPERSPIVSEIETLDLRHVTQH